MLSPSDKKVLIVDDEKEMVDLLVNRMIHYANGKYTPMVAGDGDEAIDLLKTYPFTALILDLKMHNVNGVTVCQEMIKTNRIDPLSIIISSGNITPEVQAELKTLGVTHFLKKPYEMSALFNFLDEIMEYK